MTLFLGCVAVATFLSNAGGGCPARRSHFTKSIHGLRPPGQPSAVPIRSRRIGLARPRESTQREGRQGTCRFAVPCATEGRHPRGRFDVHGCTNAASAWMRKSGALGTFLSPQESTSPCGAKTAFNKTVAAATHPPSPTKKFQYSTPINLRRTKNSAPSPQPLSLGERGSGSDALRKETYSLLPSISFFIL